MRGKSHFKPADLALDPRLPELAADAYKYLYGLAVKKVAHHSVINNKEWKRIAQNFNALAPLYGLIDHEAGAVFERNGQIAKLRETLAETSKKIEGLNQAVTERDGQFVSFNQAFAERDAQITRLNQALVTCDEQIASLNRTLVERDGQLANFAQLKAEHEARGSELATLSQRQGLLQQEHEAMQQQLAAREGELATLSQRHGVLQQEHEAKQQQLAARDLELAKLKLHCEQLQAAYSMVLNSRSWRMTAIFREVSARLRRLRRYV